MTLSVCSPSNNTAVEIVAGAKQLIDKLDRKIEVKNIFLL